MPSDVFDSCTTAVDWGATAPIDLGVMAKRVTWPTRITMEVLGKKNAASSHDWVQLVGVAVFHQQQVGEMDGGTEAGTF